jgi:glutathione S-transferase
MTGIPYQAKEIALRKMENTSKEFVQLNPFKKVPVIDDSGFVLAERYFEKNGKIIHRGIFISVWLF